MRISDWSSDVCSSDLGSGSSIGNRHSDSFYSVPHSRGTKRIAHPKGVSNGRFVQPQTRLILSARNVRPAYHTSKFGDHGDARRGAAIFPYRKISPLSASRKRGRATWRESVCQYV